RKKDRDVESRSCSLWPPAKEEPTRRSRVAGETNVDGGVCPGTRPRPAPQVSHCLRPQASPLTTGITSDHRHWLRPQAARRPTILAAPFTRSCSTSPSFFPVRLALPA